MNRYFTIAPGDTVVLYTDGVLEARSPVVSTVLTHSIDPHTGAIQLFLGRPRLNSDGGGSWLWLRPLLPSGASVRAIEDPSGPT